MVRGILSHRCAYSHDDNAQITLNECLSSCYFGHHLTVYRSARFLDDKSALCRSVGTLNPLLRPLLLESAHYEDFTRFEPTG